MSPSGRTMARRDRLLDGLRDTVEDLERRILDIEAVLRLDFPTPTEAKYLPAGRYDAGRRKP